MKWILCAVALFGTSFSGDVRADAQAGQAQASIPTIVCSTANSRFRVGGPTRFRVVGVVPVEADIQVPSGAVLFVEAAEAGIDVSVEIGEPAGSITVRADNPIQRTGTRRLVYGPTKGTVLRVRLTGKEHPKVSGAVTVTVFAPLDGAASARCDAAFRLLSAADSDYSAGQEISLGHVTSPHPTARHYYLRAVEGYLAAYAQLEGSGGTSMFVDAAHAVSAAEYEDLKDWAGSAEWAVRAREAARGASDPYSEARAEALLAASWIESPSMRMPSDSSGTPDPHARLAEARRLLRGLETFHERRGEAYDAALQYNNIGVAFFNEASFDRAEQIFRGSVSRFAALDETPRRGLSLQNIATCQWGRGELTRAERTFRLASRYLRPAPYPQAYLLMLSNFALLSRAVGHLDAALRLESEALTMAERLEARIPAGVSLHGLGLTYYALGDRDQSRYYLERAVAFHTPDVRSYVSTLRSLATVYREEGRPSDSRRMALEALSHASSGATQARIRVGLAQDDAALGHLSQALASLDEILTGHAAEGASIRVDALIARGELRRDGGDLGGARADLEEAIRVLTSLEDPEDAYQAHLDLARVLRSLGDRPEALREVDQSLRLADTLRRETANPELRARRQEPLRPAHELKIALLMELRARSIGAARPADAHRLGLEALAAAERSRAQSLADFAVQSTHRPRAVTIDRSLSRRAELYRDIAARQFQLDARRDAAGDDDPRARQYQAELAALRRDLDGLDAEIARRTGGTVATARPSPLAWVERLKKQSSDAAIVEFWLGEEGAHAWVITRDGVKLHDLGSSATINETARVLHGAMRGFTSTPLARRQEAAEALYDTIIRPLESSIESHRTLIVIPDRALTYVPFPALVKRRGAKRTYLVESHDVAMAPAAWWLFRPPSKRSGANQARRVLIVADPVYNDGDERMPSGARSSAPDRNGTAADGPLWRRLPWTAQEARNIAGLFPTSSVDRLEGLTATRDRVLSLPLADYRYIHIASHGYTDARMPQLSAIILGAYADGGRTTEQAIRIPDLQSIDLTADVVTFSACETALGKDAAGEGVMGLGYFALARGATSVVASLWPVGDEMTVTVMTEFYRSLLDTHDAPAALGKAMRVVLEQSPGLDPALWAAFQVSIGGPLGKR